MLGNIHNGINDVKRASELDSVRDFITMLQKTEQAQKAQQVKSAEQAMAENFRDAQRSQLEQPKKPSNPQSYDPKTPQKPKKDKSGLEEKARKMADQRGNQNGKLDPEEEGDYKAILAQLMAAEGGGDAGGAPPSLASYTPPSSGPSTGSDS